MKLLTMMRINLLLSIFHINYVSEIYETQSPRKDHFKQLGHEEGDVHNLIREQDRMKRA
jgi:hypothetical protein